MNLKENTTLIAILVVIILVIGGLGLTGLLWEDDDNGGNVIDVTDDPEAKNDLMEILLSSQSVRRSTAPTDPLIVADDPFLVLSSTPVAAYYQGTVLHQLPLIVDSGEDVRTGDRFISLYPNEGATMIGNVEGFNWPIPTRVAGTQEAISLSIAEVFWESSDGAIIMGTTTTSYHTSLAGIVLASYLNIPVILIDEWMNADIELTLEKLGVEYTLVFDSSEGYGRTFRFQSQDSIEEMVTRFLMNRFGGVSYVTLTNPMDLDLDYALPGISSLSPYLTASHQGLVSSAIEEPLPPEQNFREEGPAFAANVTTFRVKEKLTRTFGLMDNLSAFSRYLDDSPYLAIMGSAYSIPFYYSYLVPKGIMADSDAALAPTTSPDLFRVPSHVPASARPSQIPTPPGSPPPTEMSFANQRADPEPPNPEPPYQDINDPALVPSDDIYADVDGDLTTHELAMGRPIGINLEDASTLITRTFFYEEYMEQWVTNSPISQAIGAEWKDTAFIHCGDDWNGYVLISTPAYVEVFEYLNTHDYTTYTTIGTGETVDSVTRYFESSNLVFILAHGSQTGFHMIDGYTAADVKEWWLGPSSFVVTSCNVGNTDCPNLTNIDNSIAFAIMRTGINAFYGGMRYEYTGVYNPDPEYGLVASGSPRLSQIIIDLLTEEDLTSGMALRDGQNQYMEELLDPDGRDYDVAIKMLYGDPMFNPYEPFNAM